MALVRTLLSAPLQLFIHKDFHEAVAMMTLIDVSFYLAIRRHLHQKYNLIKICECSPERVQFDPKDIRYRRADGKYSDPFNVDAGSAGTCFGRNVPPADQKDKLMKPDPMVVATKLLARRKFKDTGKKFNMIAIELTAPIEVANQCPLKSFKFYKTQEFLTGSDEIKTGGEKLV
ncbi:alpha-dioxygenase 1-like [Fagus crenata]